MTTLVLGCGGRECPHGPRGLQTSGNPKQDGTRGPRGIGPTGSVQHRPELQRVWGRCEMPACLGEGAVRSRGTWPTAARVPASSVRQFARGVLA